MNATHKISTNPRGWDGMWSDFVQMRWASKTSLHTKVVRHGVVSRYPASESAIPQSDHTDD
jgi:hypothetical protein